MDNPPVNRLLQLLRQKPPDELEETHPGNSVSSPNSQTTAPHQKSSIQPATKSSIQPVISSTQGATKSDIQPAKKSTRPVTRRNTQGATKSSIQPVISSTQGATKSDIQPATESSTPANVKSDTQTATKSDTPGTTAGLSKGQQRVLAFFSSIRDTRVPSQTVLVGYDTISRSCFLSRSGSRKVVRELIAKRLIRRVETKRGEVQGSVYALESNTLYDTQSSTPHLRGIGIRSHVESDIQYVTSDTPSCSSSKELLLQGLILEDALHALNPRSLLPSLEQFETTEDLQDFLDMANACIAASKEGRGKPIKNPHGFLFAQLRQGYINPPDGYKSRKVRAQEIRNRQLEEELTALRQLKEQEQELRFELFKEQLTEDHTVRLESEAREQVKPGLGISEGRQFEVAKETILKQWFAQKEGAVPR